MGVRVLVVALGLQLVLGLALVLVAVNGFPTFGGEEVRRVSQQPARDAFDARRALAHLRAQVALGPRPAGSAASRRLAERLRAQLPRGRFERVPGGLRNVGGHLPGRRPAVLVGAHYDTKDIAGFVGANDGAGGTAVVVELARALARVKRPRHAPELRFVLFDGEESPRGTPDHLFEARGLRGSRAYAKRHRGELRAAVIVDFVADRRLSLPREENSDARLWGRLRAAARRAGVAAAFPARTVPPISDDHTPFTERGVPAVDLIDFEFGCFHRRCDDLRGVSVRSLDIAGEAVVELLRSYTRP